MGRICVDRGLTVKRKIRTILNDLESMRKNLLSLWDEIWLDIDHNDSEALWEGTEFKLAYNEKMDECGRADGKRRLNHGWDAGATDDGGTAGCWLLVAGLAGTARLPRGGS